MPLVPVSELAQSLESEALITLLVDPGLASEKRYHVQRTILVGASPRFKQALTGSWAESRTLKLSFPHTDSNVIQHFLSWLLQGQAQLPQDDELLPVKLWSFADEYLLPKLQNEAMRQIHNRHGVGSAESRLPSPNTIAYALNTALPSSPLYKFMMCALMWALHSQVPQPVDQNSRRGLGLYKSEELLVFEGVPGLMTEILKEFARGSPLKDPSRQLSLSAYLVSEN